MSVKRQTCECEEAKKMRPVDRNRVLEEGDWFSSCVAQYSTLLCQKLFLVVYTSNVT